MTKFPGAVGVDIAKQIDRAVQELNGCSRLIIDLRGNAGGGLAFLRVMIYLTPERIPYHLENLVSTVVAARPPTTRWDLRSRPDILD